MDIGQLDTTDITNTTIWKLPRKNNEDYKTRDYILLESYNFAYSPTWIIFQPIS